jgi:hypothetical protein
MITLYQKNLTRHMDVHIVKRLANNVFFQYHAQITSKFP